MWLWFSTKGKNAKDVETYISDLVSGGANEFFTGYNPPYWYEKFWFEVSPNGRFAEHEQITDHESLKMIVQEVHKHGFELFINLNAWYYTDVTFPYIQKMVWEFIELWIDGIICGNIGILEYLQSIDYKGKINISTIMAVYNTEAIRFFLENYKINKVILSREITLREIENIVNTFPETKFEVFGEGDFCRYNNGLCYAEHKYWVRDICTVVVNDLIFKKKFRADFKKIVLDTTLSDLDKIGYFDDRFQDIFEKISDILTKIELWMEDSAFLKEELFSIYKLSKKRVDLFFDAISWVNSDKNKKILVYFKGLNYVLKNFNNPPAFQTTSFGKGGNLPFSKGVPEGGGIISSQDKIELLELREELEESIKTWMEYFSKKLKNIGWEPKLKALETGLFYAKWDNLNLYSYLFFSKFPNIETVKFPTRWRNYNEKIKIIESVVYTQKVDENLIDRGASLERAHYDLTYLFWDKLWFRKMLKNI